MRFRGLCRIVSYQRASGNSTCQDTRFLGGRGSGRAAWRFQKLGSAGASPSQFQDTLSHLTRTTCALIVLAAFGGPVLADPLTVVEIEGDWRISESVSYANTYLKVRGNVYIERDVTLALDDCVFDVICEYARQYKVYWEGGTLITRNTTVGGSQRNGINYQTTFQLRDGLWEATDTTVRYCYGISFWDKTVGRLRAKRLIAGPNPDSIIMSGKGDVELADSTYPMAIGLYANQGGRAVLDLPLDQPISQTFDDTVIPGIEWRLKMVNSTVPGFWFVFLRRISADGPPYEVVLGDCPKILPALLGHNIQADLNLPAVIREPIRYGNLTLRPADKPVKTVVWGMYCTGPKTDVTLRGPMRICELMVWDGRVRLLGNEGTYDACCACTTLDVHGKAQVELTNAKLGRPLEWAKGKSSVIGQVGVDDEARITGQDLNLGRLHLITQDQGSITLKNAVKTDEVTTKAEGGPIRVSITGST